jgi:hypothetical protein
MKFRKPFSPNTVNTSPNSRRDMVDRIETEDIKQLQGLLVIASGNRSPVGYRHTLGHPSAIFAFGYAHSERRHDQVLALELEHLLHLLGPVVIEAHYLYSQSHRGTLPYGINRSR